MIRRSIICEFTSFFIKMFFCCCAAAAAAVLFRWNVVLWTSLGNTSESYCSEISDRFSSYSKSRATRWLYLLFHSNRKLFQGNKTEKPRRMRRVTSFILLWFRCGCERTVQTNGIMRWLVIVYGQPLLNIRTPIFLSEIRCFHSFARRTFQFW